MTGKSLNRTGFLPLMAALGLVLSSSAVTAQNPSGPAPQASASSTSKKVVPKAAAATAAPSHPLARLVSAAQGKAIRRVHLAIDGNLPGRVIRSETVAKDLPGGAKTSLASTSAKLAKSFSLRAKIWFVQDGQVVNEVKSDEFGRFQVIGLRPGVYSVVAAARDAAGVASVEVLPYQADLPKELTVLTIALGEPPAEEAAELTPAPEALVPLAGEGMAGVGAGAGALGGGGGMLGLAGLAAGMGSLAAGLGGAGGGGPPASPAVP